MPTYDYRGVDPLGDRVSGLQVADDPEDLKEILVRRGHFLVSWHDKDSDTFSSPMQESIHVPEPKPAADKNEPAVVDETTAPKLPMKENLARLVLAIPWRKVMLGIVILIGAVAADQILEWRARNAVDVNDPWVKLEQVKLGMTRDQIDTILSNPTEVPNRMTRYDVAPGMTVLVKFDNQGGPRQRTNRLIQLPQLTTASAPGR